MYGLEKSSSEVSLNESFMLPIKRKRDKSYKIPSGALVFTCFTSDFLLEDADIWRIKAWEMIKERADCMFFFFTKRIHRFMDCVPDDWGEGYDNVIVGCTVGNQQMTDYRLKIFKDLPIKHKVIIVAPFIGEINLVRHTRFFVRSILTYVSNKNLHLAMRLLLWESSKRSRYKAERFFIPELLTLVTLKMENVFYN